MDEMRRHGTGDVHGGCPHPCPICIGIDLANHMSPEVKEHLAGAGRELLLAAKNLMESLLATKTPVQPAEDTSLTDLADREASAG